MPKDVKVRLLDAPSFLDKPYTYSVPEHLDADVHPGVFVTLPFGGGNRRHVALVTAREERDPTIGAVKPIHALSTSHAALSADMLALADFLCEQTLCTMGEAVHAMLPAGVLGGLCARYRVTDRPIGDVRRLSTDEAFLYAHLAQNGECSEDALRTRFGTATEEMLDHLVKLKLVSRELVQKNAAAAKEIVTFSLAITREHAEAILAGNVKGRMGEKQKLALSLLLEGDKTAEQMREADCTKAQTDALLQKELKRFVASPVYMLNCGLGALFLPIAGVMILAFREDVLAILPLLEAITGNSEILPLFFAAMALMMCSMIDITAPSISLEGKHLWILKSLPVTPLQVLHAKLKLHLLIGVPCVAFAVIFLLIAMPMSLPFYFLIPVATLSFLVLIALAGLALNLKFPNFTWTNETAPVKQSASVTVTVFGSWGVVFGLGALYVPLRALIPPVWYLAVICALFIGTCAALYTWLKTSGTKIFEALK